MVAALHRQRVAFGGVPAETAAGRRAINVVFQLAEQTGMDTNIEIRAVPSSERAAWEPLWTGYLEFYKTTVRKEVYDATWARLHDPAEPMHLLGAYVDGRLQGIVHF